MRLVICRCLLICVGLPLTVPWTATSIPRNGSQMTDPVFGVQFDPVLVRYQATPRAVLSLCHLSRDRVYWTFAHVRKGGAEYFVEMVIPHEGEDNEGRGDVFGGAVVVSSGTCHGEDSKWMLSGLVPVGGYPTPSKPVSLPGLGAPSVCDRGPTGDCHYLLRSAAEEALLRDLVRDALDRGIQAWGSAAAFRKAVCRPKVVGDDFYPVLNQEVSRFCKQ